MVVQPAKPSATALADGLRPLAPEDWAITVSDDYDRTIKVALPDGAGLRLNTDVYGKPNRVVIGGLYPQETYYRERTGEITVAYSRGPAAILKEIQRRFLPAYLPSYAAAIEAKQRADDYQARKAADLAELAAIVGTTVQPGREQVYWYRGDRNVTIRDTYHGTARLEMSVPMSLARQILALLIAEDGQS